MASKFALLVSGFCITLDGMQKDLKSYTPTQLRYLVENLGQKPFCANYIFSFIHTKNCTGIAEITPLPKHFRQYLSEAGFYISQIKLVDEQKDPDGTVKFLFMLEDGEHIESVLLTDNDRKTVCVSTQVGCRMSCSFCATGRLKFVRNLTAAEITDQISFIKKHVGSDINNVVYMGMGEPLDNYENTLTAVKILNDKAGLNIGIRRQTISTVGLTPKILQLADEDIYPRLAVSLHSADDATRKQIVAAANKYPLKQVKKALQTYQKKTHQRITIEYCLIKDINDSTEQAKQLVKFLKGIKCNINLIEFNPYPQSPFAPSSKERITAFSDWLKKAGIETVIRYRRGRSIKAACGQLGADRLY